MGIWVERGLGAFKYLLALGMMVSGITTALGPLTPVSGALGYIYSSRVSLIWLGAIIFLSGACLLYGKIRKSKKWTGVGLMAIYLCFLFAGMLNLAAFGPDPDNWLYNVLMAVIVGSLWLRWKFKTAYLNPNHFRRDIVRIEKEKHS